MDVLKWLREEGCPWNDWTCAYAAEGGHLDVLKYARENGCLWDETTCEEAARGGHLDVLQWAHENGCQWIPIRCVFIAQCEAHIGEGHEGHYDVIDWITQHFIRFRTSPGP